LNQFGQILDSLIGGGSSDQPTPYQLQHKFHRAYPESDGIEVVSMDSAAPDIKRRFRRPFM
jgi:hypothetical protein